MCDDPFESNFFKYLAINFNKLRVSETESQRAMMAHPLRAGAHSFLNTAREMTNAKLKRLAVVLDQVRDEDGDGATNLVDVELFSDVMKLLE
ncbi:MAG: hypothetical protein IPM83_11310 [Ignavibacteria bacterium]|nr:hypothetical protein [Ignavibacteria bacterium]